MAGAAAAGGRAFASISEVKDRGGSRGGTEGDGAWRTKRRLRFRARTHSAIGRPLKHSAELLAKKLNVGHRTAEHIAGFLQRWTVQREGEDPTGYRTKRWARRLIRGLEQHPALKPALFEGNLQDTVFDTLEELEKRSSRHGDRVVAIERQHRALREGRQGDKDEYSEASAYIGEEWWVKTAHASMAQWIDEYFLLTPEQLRRGHPPWAFKSGGLPKGWKKYNVNGRDMFWNPDLKKMQLELPRIEPRNEALVPPPREPPIALLDVGSCSNPFSRFEYLVDPVALDLRPSEGAKGVFQADFFDVPIVELQDGSGSGAQPRQHVLVAKDGRLEGIVAGSFDVVVISLVLSYIPDPRKRIEMVARARRCLRDDRGLLFLLEVGSALADSSWYGSDAAADWSKAVEGAGFRTKIFEEEVKESRPRRSHRALQWVFETAPLREGGRPLEPLMTPREMPW